MSKRLCEGFPGVDPFSILWGLPLFCFFELIWSKGFGGHEDRAATLKEARGIRIFSVCQYE